MGDHLRALRLDRERLAVQRDRLLRPCHGRRGVFVYDWDGWADFYLGISRYNVADRRADPALSSARNLVAVVAAGTGAHASSLIPRTFSSPTGDVSFERVPLSLPMAEIVDRLNAIQPVSLHGYPSAMRELAEEARAGRLRIRPLRLRCGSEPLLPFTYASGVRVHPLVFRSVLGQTPTIVVYQVRQVPCGAEIGSEHPVTCRGRNCRNTCRPASGTPGSPIPRAPSSRSTSSNGWRPARSSGSFRSLPVRDRGGSRRRPAGGCSPGHDS
jgi:hypothetical protein